MLGEEEGMVREEKEAGRKEEARGQAGRPLDRETGRVGSSGPVAGSDPQPKQMYLRGLGDHSFPHTDGIKGKQEPCRAQL